MILLESRLWYIGKPDQDAKEITRMERVEVVVVVQDANLNQRSFVRRDYRSEGSWSARCIPQLPNMENTDLDNVFQQRQ